MFDVLSFTLAAPLVTAGTVTLGYPVGRARGDFLLGFQHRLSADTGADYRAPRDFEITLNAANITLTWRAAGAVPAGTAMRLDLDRAGIGPTPWSLDQAIDALGLVSGANAPTSSPPLAPNQPWVIQAGLVLANFGSPIASAANGICTTQSVAVAPASAIINGARAFTVGGAARAILDVPRNVVAAWTGTAICTVEGIDLYGRPMTQVSPSGVALTGTKAFKQVTRISFNAPVTGLTVGFGNVLGLPFVLPSVSLVLREIANGTTPTAGTLVAADPARPAGTTGDVRGTWVPNTAPDGSVGYQLLVASLNPAWDMLQA